MVQLFNIQGDTWVVDSSVDVNSTSTLQVNNTSTFNKNCFLAISLEHLRKSFCYVLLIVETNCSTSELWRRPRLACVRSGKPFILWTCSVKSKPAVRCTFSGLWEWTSRTHQRTDLDARWMTCGHCGGLCAYSSYASTNSSSHQVRFPFTFGTHPLP